MKKENSSDGTPVCDSSGTNRPTDSEHKQPNENTHKPDGRKAEPDIGYCKPPIKNQFKPGQSGNPKGRPRKRPKPSALPEPWEEKASATFLEEVYRQIPIQDGGGTRTLPAIQAIFRRLNLDAIRGDHKAQKLVMDTTMKIEKERYDHHIEYVRMLIDIKIDGEAEIERCKKHNLEPPDIIPHPANVICNLQTGDVKVVGPLSKDERDVFRRVHAFMIEEEEEITEIEKEWARAPKNDYLRNLLEERRSQLERFKQKIPEKILLWIKNGAH